MTLMRFEKRARFYSEAISSYYKGTAVSRDSVSSDRFRQQAEAFETILEQDKFRDDWLFNRAHELEQCLEELRGAITLTPPQKIELLDKLFEEYERLRNIVPAARHTILLGPLGGIPLSNTDEFLYGFGAELGWARFRLYLAGGFRSDYKARYGVNAVGWWGGIGLSGEFGDDLVHAIVGASEAARGVL